MNPIHWILINSRYIFSEKKVPLPVVPMTPDDGEYTSHSVALLENIIVSVFMVGRY